jgi:hypothetical protein
MLLKGAERPVNWSIVTRIHAPRQVGEFQHLPLTEEVTALGAVLSGRAAPPTGGRTVRRGPRQPPPASLRRRRRERAAGSGYKLNKGTFSRRKCLLNDRTQLLYY